MREVAKAIAAQAFGELPRVNVSALQRAARVASKKARQRAPGRLGGRPSNKWRCFDPECNPPRTMPTVGAPYVEAEPGGWCQRRGISIVWTCPVTNRPVRTHQPCTRLDCQTCQPAVARRRGARLMERFGGDAVFKGTFTVPQEFRDHLGAEQLRELRRLLGQMVLGWGRREFNAELGAVVCFHPTGDECDVCNAKLAAFPVAGSSPGIAPGISGKCSKCGAPPAWRPHFDVLIPLLGLRGDRVVRLGQRRGDGSIWVEKRKAAKLKALWADLLLTLAVVMKCQLRSKTADMLCGLQDMRRAVVHFNVRRSEEQIGHAFRYSARPFTAYCVTDDLGSLRSPAVYGLASPGATKSAQDHDREAAKDFACTCRVCRWRAGVAHHVEREGFKCTCCDVPQPLQLLDVYSRFGPKARLWDWVPLLSSEQRHRGACSEASVAVHDGGADPPPF